MKFAMLVGSSISLVESSETLAPITCNTHKCSNAMKLSAHTTPCGAQEPHVEMLGCNTSARHSSQEPAWICMQA
jgi:hypothetical protein